MDLFRSQDFRRFLQSLRIDPDTTEEREAPGEPEKSGENAPMFLLQQSREHDAFYRLDLGTLPELRVFVARDQGPLKFEVYLVQPSPCHPLSNLFPLLDSYQGSAHFDEQRDDLVWLLLFAVGESLKKGFWAGWQTPSFPPEITVEKIA